MKTVAHAWGELSPPAIVRRVEQAGAPIIEHVTVRRSRCVDKELAADYLGVSVDSVERLIHTGALPIVKLPIEHHKQGTRVGLSRRVLIDVKDLDALIERSKESVR